MFSTTDKKKEKINFRFQKAISISSRSLVKNAIVALFKKENQKLESLDIVFCSDEYLLDINKVNLQHNYYTDTITFNYAPKNQKEVLGEIYISVDRVRDNAARYNSSIKTELLRVIFHSSLHLCGYKDKSPAQKKEMTLKEEYYLGSYKKHVSRGT
jgi:rRNA maturation RNase YbeY